VLTYSSEGQAAAALIVDQINRVTTSFLEHNVGFEGDFHLIGHGVGGCLLLNILSTNPGGLAAGAEAPAGQLAEDDSAETDAGDEADAGDAAAADTDAAVAEADTELPTLAEFFASHDLSEFVPKLEKEEVTMETLLELVDADYSELGFNMGQRKRLMKGVKVCTSLRAQT
jgi:hypothetical protein